MDYKNRGRHMVLYLFDGRIFYCPFKREFIHSFSIVAKDLLLRYPDLAGRGESINVEWCMWAKKHGCQLVYIYENESMYQISPNTVMNISVTHEQKQENKYIEGNVHVVKHELEYWFPIKLMQRFEV